jgi:hypothetical protein
MVQAHFLLDALRVTATGRTSQCGRLRILGAGAGALFVAHCVACQSPAIVRTARTLPAGANDFSLSLNLAHVSARAAGAPGAARAAATQFNYPELVPELMVSHGITDDVELGGRVGLGAGLFELNSKLRFLRTADDRFHAALAPALGYRVLGIVDGPVLTLPLLLTYELSPNVALSGGLLASYSSYHVPGGLSGTQADLGGNTLYLGGGAGLELRLGGFHLFPAVELQRSVFRDASSALAPEINMLFFSFTIGIGGHAKPPHEPAPAPAPAPPPEPPPAESPFASPPLSASAS